jgi:hypothetical protein
LRESHSLFSGPFVLEEPQRYLEEGPALSLADHGLREALRHQEEPSCLGTVFSAEGLSLGKAVTESWSLGRRAAAVFVFF